MAKRDKEYEIGMFWYLSAFNKAKKEGLDALERDIRNRNLLKLNIKIPEQKMIDDYTNIARKTVVNIMACALWTLHDSYGFGKKRLNEFRAAFEKIVRDVCDLDYMGQRYVRLEDFAVELNERYDLEIDVNCVAACQDTYDEGEKMYGMCKVDRIIRELKENGFADAAEFLEKKLD